MGLAFMREKRMERERGMMVACEVEGRVVARTEADGMMERGRRRLRSLARARESRFWAASSLIPRAWPMSRSGRFSRKRSWTAVRSGAGRLATAAERPGQGSGGGRYSVGEEAAAMSSRARRRDSLRWRSAAEWMAQW